MIGKIVFAGIAVIGISIISDLKDRIKKLEAESVEDKDNLAYSTLRVDQLKRALADRMIREDKRIKIGGATTNEELAWTTRRAEQAEKSASSLYEEKCLDVVSGAIPWRNEGDWASEHAVDVQGFYDEITHDEDQRIKNLEIKRLKSSGLEDDLRASIESIQSEEPVSLVEKRKLEDIVTLVTNESEDIDKMWLL